MGKDLCLAMVGPDSSQIPERCKNAKGAKPKTPRPKQTKLSFADAALLDDTGQTPTWNHRESYEDAHGNPEDGLTVGEPRDKQSGKRDQKASKPDRPETPQCWVRREVH